ncbi:MAG TPA: glutamate-5-semialdehyde dehydrogenase [Acidobacteriota bacterium]|nr:glutamate-5-semialdehyde dehydrogenase [Acidobacteriota bacterium]
MQSELTLKGECARKAARQLAILDTRTKNRALKSIALGLLRNGDQILEANKKDIDAGRAAGLSDALLDRLLLTRERMEAIARDIDSVIALPDPVGQRFDSRILENGLQISKCRIPIGVIGVIYEARPNVTIDVSTLCLKSGNAVILRGGKEARESNQALTRVLRESLEGTGVPAGAVQIIESTDRSLVGEMLKAHQYIDMIIPRGGAALHQFARDNATIPVITGGIGICHTYIDKTANLKKATEIVFNAKVQRPTVCNALDTLLVHRDVAVDFLPTIHERLKGAGVEFRCDSRALSILGRDPSVRPAGEKDFDTEFLALILAVKIVDGIDEALSHIQQHGTQHSDAIVTEDYTNSMRFVQEVDSATVYVNASTRFTDGGQFGLGAEVAVSTQRLHARGPMGLQELTTYKWIILGAGQVRE